MPPTFSNCAFKGACLTWLKRVVTLFYLPMAGTVRVKLYKGNVMVTGRKSPYSLYDKLVASFEDDGGLYNQADAGRSPPLSRCTGSAQQQILFAVSMRAPTLMYAPSPPLSQAASSSCKRSG